MIACLPSRIVSPLSIISLYHLTWGGGIPVTWQRSMTVSPTNESIVLFWSSMRGGAETQTVIKPRLTTILFWVFTFSFYKRSINNILKDIVGYQIKNFYMFKVNIGRFHVICLAMQYVN